MPNQVIIYRVEHLESGKGPFNHWPQVNQTASLFGEWWTELYKKPAPAMRDLCDDYETWVFWVIGCRSLRELAFWFPRPLLRRLYKADFRIVRYVVADSPESYRDDNHQCIFHRPSATLLERGKGTRRLTVGR